MPTTIQLNKKNLLTATKLANNFTDKTTPMITLEAALKNIVVKSTNSTQNNETRVPCTIKEGEFKEFSLDGKKLQKALDAIVKDDVKLEIDESKNTLHVKQGRQKYKIDITESTYHRRDTGKKVGSFELTDEIKEKLRVVSHGVNPNNPNIALQGVCLDSDGKTLNLVGGAQERICLAQFQAKFPKGTFVIPVEAIKSIIKIFAEFKVDINITDTCIFFEVGNIYYSCQLIAQTFPDYKAAFPEQVEQSITLAKNDLVDLIKKASIFEDAINIKLDGKKIIVSDVDADNETNSNTMVDLAFKHDGEAVQIGTKASFLLEFLSNVEDENIVLKYNNTYLPFFIKSSSFTELVAPRVIEKEEDNNDAQQAS